MMNGAVGRTWTPGMMSSIRRDWGTPDQLFQFMQREFCFVLDACATPDNAKCARFFTEDEDALTQDWLSRAGGGPIWCNPPYGRQIDRWIAKAFDEARRGARVVMLLPARTDTSWFHDFCLQGEIRFLRGRLRFDNSRRGRCPFPSMIVIFKPWGGRRA